jgi:glyoxylase-like metal-dependent hydrolase (beta-lactamase superfamily II)
LIDARQGLPVPAAAQAIARTAPGDTPEATGRGWRVESLGHGAYLFRWHTGFYLSAFFVGRNGVTAIDPISPAAALAYREAIRSVTRLPIERIVYSHEHRDHICGGAALLRGADDGPAGESASASVDCEVCAHASAAARIARRGDTDVLAPTRMLGDGAVIADGSFELAIRYFGPNHSDSNLLFLTPTDRGRLLIWVDGVEPDTAPYRNLPDTDFAGYLHTLDCAAALEFDQVAGGHTGPGDRHWVSDYREYVRRLLDATDRAYRAAGGQTPRDGEDGVAMTERVRGEVTRTAAAELQQRFGHWSGYREWAPQTADRILSFLITGN